MPQFADVIYSILDIRIAALLGTGSYATTSYSLEYGSKMSFEAKADNDTIKAYGLITEALAITTHLEGTLEQAALDPDALAVLCGVTNNSSGSTPNRVVTTDFVAGGNGLPYFGAVGLFASNNGGVVMLGLRKCLLDNLPGWDVAQNKFRISSVGFKAFAIDTTSRNLHRIKRYETAAAIPADLNQFFA